MFVSFASSVNFQPNLDVLPSLQEPKLWYGIGILYDRYGSLEHAEEAFSSVIRMDPSASVSLFSLFHLLISSSSVDFEKSNEIFFRLGIIYKQQRKSAQSLEVCWNPVFLFSTWLIRVASQCFRYILSNPPRPLTEIDIWFQIGHVYEQQKDASPSYSQLLRRDAD